MAPLRSKILKNIFSLIPTFFFLVLSVFLATVVSHEGWREWKALTAGIFMYAFFLCMYLSMRTILASILCFYAYKDIKWGDKFEIFSRRAWLLFSLLLVIFLIGVMVLTIVLSREGVATLLGSLIYLLAIIVSILSNPTPSFQLPPLNEIVQSLWGIFIILDICAILFSLLLYLWNKEKPALIFYGASFVAMAIAVFIAVIFSA